MHTKLFYGSIRCTVCFIELLAYLSSKVDDDCPSSSFKVRRDRSGSFTTKKCTKRDRPTETEDLPSHLSQTANKKFCTEARKPHDTLFLISDIAERMKLLRQMFVNVPVDTTSLNLLLHRSQSKADSFQPSQLPTSARFEAGTNHSPLNDSRYKSLCCNNTKNCINLTSPAGTSSTAERSVVCSQMPLVHSTLGKGVVTEEKTKKSKTNDNGQLASEPSTIGLPNHTCKDTNEQVPHDAIQDCKSVEEIVQSSPVSGCSVTNANMQSGM